MACPPPVIDWSSWATWSCLREDIAPILTFVGAAIVAWAALAQARIARRRHQEQTKADLERRITESFAKAVEQLGSENLATRLGGIYTLERLASESEREHWPIMETLTAYVREPPRQSHRLYEGALPATDVQAALTVLGRRKEERRKQERDDQRLNLSETYLQGADLSNAHLEGANLGGAHLQGANLQGARLEDANLQEARLEGAHLEAAQDLTQEQINSAFGDENTMLPGGLDPPAQWTKH
jgi:hypothetical protein